MKIIGTGGVGELILSADVSDLLTLFGVDRVEDLGVPLAVGIEIPVSRIGARMRVLRQRGQELGAIATRLEEAAAAARSGAAELGPFTPAAGEPVREREGVRG